MCRKRLETGRAAAASMHEDQAMASYNGRDATYLA